LYFWEIVHETSPMRVRATRRFFFGGSELFCSSATADISSVEEDVVDAIGGISICALSAKGAGDGRRTLRFAGVGEGVTTGEAE